MKLFNYEFCTPSIVYFVIALIVTLVVFILNLNTAKIFPLLSQILSIIICTFILAFICNLGQNAGLIFSWIITGLFICSTIMGIIGAISGTGGITTPSGTIGTIGTTGNTPAQTVIVQ